MVESLAERPFVKCGVDTLDPVGVGEHHVPIKDGDSLTFRGERFQREVEKALLLPEHFAFAIQPR